EQRDGADARAAPAHRRLERLLEHRQGEQGADGHRDDDEGRSQDDPAVRLVGHGVSMRPSRTGMSSSKVAAMATPRPTQGMGKPPRRSTARPKSGGHTVTPADATARPSPTAVPAARTPTISARSVCWTPFQPMPTNPKARARKARSHQLVPDP